MFVDINKTVVLSVFACLLFSASLSAQQSCSNVNEYPNWPAKDWSGGDYNHANSGDRMVYQGKLYQANWYTSTVPGSDTSWALVSRCDDEHYGSSCSGGGPTIIVSSTIRIEDGGTFDGGCHTYSAAGSLGDEGQIGPFPLFRVGPGLIRNLYIGRNAFGGGIDSRNGGDVENIYWSDVGEKAMTIRSPSNGATVTTSRIEGYDSVDEFLQANDDAKWVVNNCRVDNAGKFLRQNSGKTFPLHVEVTNCYISNMKEGVFRSDSPNSTARITKSRLKNAGDVCIGSWKSCEAYNIRD